MRSNKFKSDNHIIRQSPQADKMGARKYRERIHKSSKNEDYLNLPYTIGKVSPKLTQKSRDVLLVCNYCNHIHTISRITVGTTCHKCKKWISKSFHKSYMSYEELLADE